MRTRVKICGITTAEDAAAAAAAGADAVGVVLAPSPRRVTLGQALEALSALPPLVSRVGVFVDPTREEVATAVSVLGLDLVQFCGDESPEACSASPVPVVKVAHIGTAFDSMRLEPYRGLVAAILLDTQTQGMQGGTGKTFSWHTLHEPPAWAPLFIAGGLRPGNVREAITALRPYAVDVSSGVESGPGHKDSAKMRAFVAAVRAADAEACVDADADADTGAAPPRPYLSSDPEVPR